MSNEHVYQDRLQFQQAVADIYKVFNGNKFQFQQAVRSSHRFVLFVQNAASSMFQNTSIHRDIGGGLKVSCVEIVYQCEDRRLSQLHPRQSHSTPHCANLTPPCPVRVAITKGDHLSGDFIQRGTEEGPKKVAVGCEYNFVRSNLCAEDIDDDIAELLCFAKVHQGAGGDLLAPQHMFASLYADTSVHLQIKCDRVLKLLM